MHRYDNHVNRYDTAFINLSDSRTLLCVITSLCSMSVFVIIGLITNRNSHRDSIVSTYEMKSNIISVGDMNYITRIYIICIVFINAWCIILYSGIFAYERAASPASIDTYNNCDVYFAYELLRFSSYFGYGVCIASWLVLVFIIHAFWNLRMIAYYYNKHDCQQLVQKIDAKLPHCMKLEKQNFTEAVTTDVQKNVH